MNPRTQVNTPIQQSTHVQQQEEGIKINGMEQVIQMLRHADLAFRESLLKRISQRDPNLALNLRKLFR